MKLDIQLFAEESAANEEVVEDTTEDTFADGIEEDVFDGTSEIEDEEDEDLEPPKSTKDTTKEYSERLKKDRENIRKELEKEQNEKLTRIAKSRGFDSWEELEEFSNKQQLEDLGVEDADAFKEYLNNVINNNPEIIRAKQIIAEQQARETERKLEEEVKQIGELDPSIKSVQDLIQHPSYDRVLDRVKKGSNIIDAYKLENFDALTHRSTDAAVQSVYNNINNKQHIKTTSGNTTKDIVVPSDVYAMYKRNLPNWSDEQIKKHYANEMEGMK